MTESDDRLLLLIDDDPAQSRLLGVLTAREGWRMLIARDAENALAMLECREGADTRAIILDQRVGGAETCGLLGRLRQAQAHIPIVVLATKDSSPLAVDAMRAGASDYVTKPIAPDRLLLALRSGIGFEAPRDELQPLAEKHSPAVDFDAMIGTASNFRAAIAKAAKAARGQGHVLVEGERGTGKEMLLRAMHATSPRAKAPLRVINARAVPANSVESLLFGHEPNSFPGAFERRIGALQECDGGTLIIDEIDRLDMLVQEKLADVLAGGAVRPIGASHGFRVDVRLMGASNMPLSNGGEKSYFNPRLLAAFSQARIPLPALRERPSDIPALARHFLARMGDSPGLRRLAISDDALALLAAYDWPGNVRQLQAVLFRAAVFCDSRTLTAEGFPQLSAKVGEFDNVPAAREGAGVALYTDDGNLRPLEEIEADVIRLAIGHYRGCMTEVARRLGIGRSTLYRKLSDLGIGDAA